VPICYYGSKSSDPFASLVSRSVSQPRRVWLSVRLQALTPTSDAPTEALLLTRKARIHHQLGRQAHLHKVSIGVEVACECTHAHTHTHIYIYTHTHTHTRIHLLLNARHGSEERLASLFGVMQTFVSIIQHERDQLRCVCTSVRVCVCASLSRSLNREREKE
jgi:hypothetical protein